MEMMPKEDIRELLVKKAHLSEDAIELYLLLLEKGFDHFVEQKEIISSLPQFFSISKSYMKGSTNMCPHIWDVVNMINNSLYIPNIVITNCYHLKIANEEEAAAYENSLYKNGIKRLVRASRIRIKRGRNGQGQLLGNVLHPYDETFINTYLKMLHNEDASNGND